MSTTPFNRAAVETWIDDDPNMADAGELRGLLALSDDGDEGATAELADRFSGMLTFGTAGLRGHLGAGPNRMNRAVVIRAAAGLTNFSPFATTGWFHSRGGIRRALWIAPVCVGYRGSR